MEEYEILRIIRQAVKQELASISLASILSNETNQRSTIKRNATDSPIDNLRNVQPYGFASSAPAGTAAVLVPVDFDPTHLNVMGHFDTNKPACADGEALLYGAEGQVLFLKGDGTIRQGTISATSPVVLGDVLQNMLDDLINSFLDAVQIGFDPETQPITLDPGLRAQLTTIKETYLDTMATNILGQKNFVDRGS